MLDREFIPIGKRLIDCTKHCPATEEGDGEEQDWASGMGEVIKTTPYSFWVPVCKVPGAPMQEGKIPEGGSQKRVCVYWAKVKKWKVEEK